MMNKAERAELQRLRERLAFRLTDAVPPDLPVPEPMGAETRGWLPQFPGSAVRCVSRSGAHWRKVGSDWATLGMLSYCPGVALYSTRALAIRAVRAQHEGEMARTLWHVDELIRGAEVLDAADAEHAEQRRRLEALSPTDRADVLAGEGEP